MLTEPFSRLRQIVQEDRELALMVGGIYLCVKDQDFYSDMANWIEQVRYWTMLALCCREDMKDLLAEAALEIDNEAFPGPEEPKP